MKRVWGAFFLLVTNTAFAWTLVGSDVKGWRRSEIEIFVNPDDCPVSQSELYDIVDRAIDSWNNIPNSHVTLRRAKDPAKVTVAQFADGKAKLVPVFLCDKNFGRNNRVDVNQIPAATRLAFNDAHIDYAGILLNAQEGARAEISKLEKEELAVTLAHELGHVLGLGHSSKQEALMYYSIGGKDRITVTQDDMDGLTYLYPKNLTSGALSCAAVHSRDTRVFSASWIWAALVIVGNLGLGRVFVRRRRLLLSPARLP